MPDRKKLAQYLRDLLTAQADVTATPQMPRQPEMTIGPRTGVRDPAPQSGPLAAIARSMAPSEDTPMGMVNEMFNPLRQGAAARELAGKAVGAIQRRELGKAAGLGALAAMSVPGVPGDETARMIDVDGVMRSRLNAAGRPIHPTDEGIRNFWRWFGDSKTVDADGKPIPTFHGTTATDLDAFDASKSGASTGNVTARMGLFTSNNPAEAGRYPMDFGGGKNANVIPLYTRIENPYQMPYREFDDIATSQYNNTKDMVIRGGNMTSDQREKIARARQNAIAQANARRDELMAGGHDGFIVDIGGNKELVAFDPIQLKSSIGNSGAFSRTDPRITASILAALGLGAASKKNDE